MGRGWTGRRRGVVGEWVCELRSSRIGSEGNEGRLDGIVESVK